MPTKKNKATKLPTTKQLTKLPPKNSKLLYHVNNLGVTKTWQRSLSRCNGSRDRLSLLWPQIYHLDDSPYNSLESIIRLKKYVAGIFTRFIILPSTNAKTQLNHASISPCRVINPISMQLILSGVSSPALIAYCKNQLSVDGSSLIYDYILINYECDISDPFDAKRKCMQFTSIIKFEGVYFALSLQGALVVIQEINSRLTITSISSSRAVPSVSSRFFREYLVELDGEILLVFLINQKSDRVVDRVEVFRLRFPDLKWITVEMIRGKTLFLDQCRLQVNSSENVSRKNCIYFTHGSSNEWWVYEMETNCILPASEDESQFESINN